MQAAEASLRQAEQETPPSQSPPTEFAKQQSEFAKHRATAVSEGETALQAVETPANGRHAQPRTIASDLLYWKGGLKVLRIRTGI